MTLILALKLLAVIVSTALAGGILARDHGLKANRLIAAFLLCNAYWASGEFMLYQSTDAEEAARICRAMSLGWIPLGVLCAHASVTLSGIEHHPVTKIIPICYVALTILLPISMGTDWVISGAEQTLFGWRPTFGMGMGFAYLGMFAPLVGVSFLWRDVLRIGRMGGQLFLGRIIFYGILAALVAGTLTSIIFPILEINAVGVTTTLLSGVGIAAACMLHRFSHSLISADAFSREILDTLEDGVVVVGEDGVLRDSNRAFLRMVGASEAYARGRLITDWIPTFPFSSNKPGASEASTFHEMGTRAGVSLPVVLSAPVDCLAGGRRIGQAFLLRDRREIVSLQQQLVVSARLAAVGELTKSISRSINEPVAHVRSEFEGLAIDWQTAENIVELSGLESECREALDEGHELISECVEGIDRIFSVVREVTGFSAEKEKADFAPHALDLIVSRAIRIAQVQAPEGFEIESRLDPDVKILCHFSEIERVVTNLLVNGLHALEGKAPGEGHLVVAVVSQGGRALLHIEDNGCGIDSAALERIFDPFFTTKPVGKGTGLGLAISYHTLRSHGGEIRVSSVPHRGTSVSVELPRAPRDSD